MVDIEELNDGEMISWRYKSLRLFSAIRKYDIPFRDYYPPWDGEEGSNIVWNENHEDRVYLGSMIRYNPTVQISLAVSPGESEIAIVGSSLNGDRLNSELIKFLFENDIELIRDIDRAKIVGAKTASYDIITYAALSIEAQRTGTFLQIEKIFGCNQILNHLFNYGNLPIEEARIEARRLCGIC